MDDGGVCIDGIKEEPWVFDAHRASLLYHRLSPFRGDMWTLIFQAVIGHHREKDDECSWRVLIEALDELGRVAKHMIAFFNHGGLVIGKGTMAPGLREEFVRIGRLPGERFALSIERLGGERVDLISLVEEGHPLLIESLVVRRRDW